MLVTLCAHSINTVIFVVWTSGGTGHLVIGGWRGEGEGFPLLFGVGGLGPRKFFENITKMCIFDNLLPAIFLILSIDS